MFVINNLKNQRVPIKVWLESLGQLEETCLHQAYNLARLPFIYKWVALMPDTHAGYGMPIGGVIAAKKVVIPNAVGVDIGCGVSFVDTNIPVEVLYNYQDGKENLLRKIVDLILATIPTGFDKYNTPQDSLVLNKLSIEYREIVESFIFKELENARYQLGTLGGGNHFIEFQQDEEKRLGIMVHSGSRHLGYSIAKNFNDLARKLNKKWNEPDPVKYDLSYLPEFSKEGQAYLYYMNLALAYARENRQVIISKIKNIVQEVIDKYQIFKNPEFFSTIDIHHNYASCEEHFGEKVWIHRKGAIKASTNQIGIIPGAMGSYSYIIEGKGNPDSFESCSHGAGRVISRRQANQTFTTKEVLEDLHQRNVILGKKNKKNVAEECIWSYKPIEEVIKNELDLIKIKKKLKTVAVVKG